MAVDTYTWTDPQGTETDLSTGPDIITLWGVKGDGLMPVTHVEYQVPLQPGSQLRYTRIEARDVDLPLLVKGADGDEPSILAVQRALAATFYPALGDGTLRVTKSDGSQRQLTCRYSEGLIGDTSMAVAAVGYREVIVVFHAFDPFWYAVSPVVTSYTIGTPATFFPFFPLVLTNVNIFAQPTITNGGDVEAWPVWTVTGPGSGLTLTNLTTGQTLSFPSLTLAAGDRLVIDTRPGKKSVVQNGVTNRYGLIATGGALWALAAGANSVSLQLSGATAASAVQLAYTPRYVSS